MSSRPSHSKRPRFNHYKDKKNFRGGNRNYLEVGQSGFLATCNFREKECVRECFNILNEYADELYGPQNVAVAEAPAVPPAESTAEEAEDISDELQKEIEETVAIGAGGKAKNAAIATGAKAKVVAKPNRFYVVDTATANCVFIRTTLTDPVELGQRIVKDIANTREQKTRFLHRLLPIETICHANIDDIIKAGGQLCDKYFLKNGSTYSIVFNKRYNNDIKRDGVINALAELVKSKNVNNKVDLKNPEKSFVVEIIKGLCCITVVEGYLKYKKYNLIELANAESLDSKLESKLENEELSEAADVAETEETKQNVAEPSLDESKDQN